MPAQRLFSELIGDIYEASYQPSYWPVVIEKICRITSSRSGAIVMQDMTTKEGNGLYPHGLSREVLFDYSKYAHLDPAFRIMQFKPVGQAVNILTDVLHEYESDEFHHMIRRRADLGYIAGATIVANETQTVGLALHRSFNATPYEEDTLQLVSDLIPHLERALRIHREFIRLRVEQSALAAGFESLTMGLVLLDHLGAPVYFNPVAREILEDHPAISITNEVITPSNREDATHLRRLILDCLQPSKMENRQRGGVIGLHHESRRHPLAVMIKPVATSELANRVDGIPVYAALYLCDPSRPIHLSADTLGKLYKLTRTESQIAIALANGMGVEEIAQAHRRSVNTVRTQLRSIFQKTNTNSQADLIRVLLTGAL